MRTAELCAGNSRLGQPTTRELSAEDRQHGNVDDCSHDSRILPVFVSFV